MFFDLLQMADPAVEEESWSEDGRVHPCYFRWTPTYSYTPGAIYSSRLGGSSGSDLSSSVPAPVGLVDGGSVASSKRAVNVDLSATGVSTSSPSTVAASSPLEAASMEENPAAASSPPTIHILWDYENVLPRVHLSPHYALGAQPTVTFFSKLRQHLLSVYGTGSRLGTLHAHLGNRGGIERDIDVLGDLQFTVLVARSKREAADQALIADAHSLAGQAEKLRGATGKAQDPMHLVILSSDKDFGGLAKSLHTQGHHVIVVHNADRNSAHEAILAIHADRTIHVDEFLPRSDNNNKAPITKGNPSSPTSVTSLRIQGRDIPIPHFFRNEALNDLISSPPEPEAMKLITLCDQLGKATHNALRCPQLHVLPSSFTIEGQVVPRDSLRRNVCLDNLANKPGWAGRWCGKHDQPNHDWATCTYAHPL